MQVPERSLNVEKILGEIQMCKIIKSVCFAFVILIIAISLFGCNTVHGAGEDVEQAGQSIERSADK